jgi:hypothetical protein
MLAKSFVLAWQQGKPTKHHAVSQHKQQRGEDATDPPRVEICDSEVPLLKAIVDDAGDEKPGDDEEYVNAYEPAWHCSRGGVKPDNRQNSKGAESIDLWTVLWTRIFTRR